MTRRSYVPWRGLIVGLVISALLCVSLYLRFGCSDSERQACLDRGGRVQEVHGGKGGWICAESSAR
jgi:hypothetical protein